jgi:hypothetical protein
MGRTWTPEPCKCKWCGEPTPMTGTKLCTRCWEMWMRIVEYPHLAQRMLAEVLAYPPGEIIKAEPPVVLIGPDKRAREDS